MKKPSTRFFEAESPLFPLTIFALISLVYAFFFPFSYFRHDDWIHLGNSTVFLPQDWSLLWKTKQYYGTDSAEIWFFRPLVKGLVYVLYQWFGYQNSLWLAAQWLCLGGAMALAAHALYVLTGKKQPGAVFALLFLTSMHLHFGSVMWVGEGIMNCPQVFFMALALWAFTLAYQRNNRSGLWLLASTISFIIALGFKESSAALVGVLGTLLFLGSAFNRRWFFALPHLIVALGYVYFRVVVLPLNPFYTPKFNSSGFLVSLLTFLGGLSLTLVSALWLTYPSWKERVLSTLSKWLLLIPLMILILAPHIGHPFFSPGWLLLPGFFLAWFLGFLTKDFEILPAKHQRTVYATTFLLSTALILFRTTQIGWWKWKESQVTVHELIQNLPDSTDSLEIIHCPSKSFKRLYVSRVIGDEPGFQHMWRLHHPTSIPVRITPCRQRQLAFDSSSPQAAFILWDFPKAELIAKGSQRGLPTPN